MLFDSVEAEFSKFTFCEPSVGFEARLFHALK